MLSDRKKAPVARDDMACPSLHGSGGVLVVIGVLAHARQLLRVRDDVSQHDDVLEPELCVGAAREPAHLLVAERSQHLVHDRRWSTTSKLASRRKRSMSRPGVPAGWMIALT